MTAKQARVVTGRIVHDVPLAAADHRCHAGAGHGNARNRGAFGVLCRPCLSATLSIIGVSP